MPETKIEWADLTFNPWHGCEKVSPGCAKCYAEGQSNRFNGAGMWGAGHGFRFQSDAYWEQPIRWARTWPAKLGRRPRVFCASMADVFEERPELDEHRGRLFELVTKTPELDWLILTKRPELARDWLRANDCASWDIAPVCLSNVWMGVSIENARFTWRADVLREIPAAVRFISAEPLLGSLFDRVPVETLRSDGVRRVAGFRKPLDLTGIDWVIIGGESGPKARPFHLDHARELLQAADRENFDRSAGDLPPLAMFVKQLGRRPVDRHPNILAISDAKGGDWHEWPDDLRIREFPEGRDTFRLMVRNATPEEAADLARRRGMTLGDYMRAGGCEVTGDGEQRVM